MTQLRFVDLFAGMGGFHRALTELGHECVFASELDDELRELYVLNFPRMRGRTYGDIRESKGNVPPHDILCAGFPCQPFSKSGGQRGMHDKTRGTLFHEILEILETHKPRWFILENVGNFERHDNGRTWSIVRESLESHGYRVRGTEHVTPRSSQDWRDRGGVTKVRRRLVTSDPERGHGLISPHHFGFPHHRERFFIIGSRASLPLRPFPQGNRRRETSLDGIIKRRSDLSPEDAEETKLSPQQVACIEHWNKLVKALPANLKMPGFPIWGDELGATYPYEQATPWTTPLSQLRREIGLTASEAPTMADALALVPSYAREPVPRFRDWKIHYIRQNRAWFREIKPYIPAGWAAALRRFPPSLRKLEWNNKDGPRDLWKHMLQFRPSGLRVKRYNSVPALVAMTVTQIPLLGPERRFLTRSEGLRLQGFPVNHALPRSRQDAFAALGNAVHVGVVKLIAERLIQRRQERGDELAPIPVQARR